MSLSVDISFTDSYYKKLGLKKDASYEKALDNSVDHALNDAENTMKREAPIDTGNLRRSTHKRKTRPLTGEIRNTARSGKNRKLYWQFVNFGTSKQAPNPFVNRTVNKIAPKMTEYVHEELDKIGVLK